VAYFAQKSGRAARGLVCVNHEYVNAELIWPGHRGAGMKADARKSGWTDIPQAVAFMQAAHGVTVMQLYRDAKGWTRDLSARENRRITARTPMDIHGPARGHELLRTHADPTGTRVLGTFANCSAGRTPWGTYLTSEENIDDYFAGGPKSLEARQRSCADRCVSTLRDSAENSFYGWDVQDSRFDARAEPREALRFGWMVEIDPHDPHSVPRKRTSLGRFQHEGANTIVGKTGPCRGLHGR
jgi:secreted PhoX family phosphatase